MYEAEEATQKFVTYTDRITWNLLKSLEFSFKKSLWNFKFELQNSTVGILQTGEIQRMQLLGAKAFKEALEALPTLMFIMLVMAYGFAALLYLVEPRDTLPTLPYAAWLVISTITTVGFGDVVPSTQSGLVLTSILMVVSSLYMAMPLAVIGHSFNTIWVNRKRILLLNKTRSRLWKWGFGPYEMRHLFGLFDLDQSDEVDLPEFQILPLRTTVERGWTGNKVKRKHANSKRQCKTMQDCIPEYSWQIP